MISIIVATYNRTDCLIECLESVFRQTYADYEVIVIFNGAADNDRRIITERCALFPRIRFIINERNLLFCKAYNQGINDSAGEFVVCLNDDVVIAPDFIKLVVESFNREPRIGMACGKLLRADKTLLDSTGLFLGKSGNPVERGYGKRDTGRYDQQEYVFGVSGACAMYRRSMLEDIKGPEGYFDEQFGMFYEDLDLSWRAHNKGWRAYYIPEAVGYHRRGASAHTVIPPLGFLRQYCFARLSDELKARLVKNRYLTMKKNATFMYLVAHLPFIAAYECKLYVYLVLFSPGALLEMLKMPRNAHHRTLTSGRKKLKSTIL
jgi:GT2 family glycosyltransferase